MDIVQKLSWRYAVKKFDPNKKLTNSQINQVLDCLNLSPSSMGLQSYQFVLVETVAIKQELLPHTYYQSQITDCSHAIVIASRTNVDKEYIGLYADFLAKERTLEAKFKQAFIDSAKEYIGKLKTEEKTIWLSNQAYLAAGNLLTCCAVLDIDACPMEGFNKEEYNKILGLVDLNLQAEIVITLGYRATDDIMATLKKVRRPISEMLLRR